MRGGVRPPRTDRSVACAEVGARHGREHLLLVVDRPTAVGDDIGRVVGRDKEGVDVARGDREPEVVADEADAAVRVGARQLRQTPNGLPWLLRVPAVGSDPVVASDRDGAAAAVLVGLERDVDAEVRASDVGREDARFVRARQTPVVEGNCDGSVRPGGD